MVLNQPEYSTKFNQIGSVFQSLALDIGKHLVQPAAYAMKVVTKFARCAFRLLERPLQHDNFFS